MANYISEITLPNSDSYQLKDKSVDKIFYGTCSTAAETSQKDVTVANADFTNDNLIQGTVLFVTFTATNSAAVRGLKLKVGSADAKPLKRLYNASATENIPDKGYLLANQTYPFYYNGTNWVVWMQYNTNSTYSYMRPYENTGKGSYSTQGANPAKTAPAGYKFQLSAGKYFMYTHYYDNTAQSALTLNIGSTGAKPIYINGQPSSSTNYTLPGGQYLVYYDGTNYHFRTDNKIPGNITGDAATVNGLTVQTAVPENAVFTDHYAWGDITGKPTSIALTGAVTASATTLGSGAISIATTANHSHGNITNGGLLGTANRLVWTDGDKKVYAGYHYATTDKVAINSTTAPTENFYVSGTTQFNIGTSDTSSNKRLKIVGNGRFLSFGGSGIMAYNTSNGTDSNGTLSLQYYGGNVNIGNASNTVATTIYGSLTLPTNSTAFNFSGMGAASDNVARNIWFSYNGQRGTPVYDDDFKYNPSTNTITIGTGTLSATQYSGNAATATSDGSGNNIASTYLTKAAGVTNVAWDGTNKKLTKTINGSTTDIVTIATLKTALNMTASDLGLSNALHFIGITSTELSDGSTTSTLTAKSEGSLSKTTGFVDGDVVMDGDQLREYVWSGSAWRLLGVTASEAYSQSATGNSWITSITQGTDGRITATTGSLNTSGEWSGSAGSLKNTKTIWGQNFNGTQNVTGNMTNVGPDMKLPQNQTVFNFYTSTGGAANAKFGKLGLNSTYANIDITNYTLDVGGKTRVSDYIYRAYSSSDSTPMIWMNGSDQDNWLWKISSGTTNDMYFGYGLKYIGKGSGVANYLRLYADNQNGTEVIAVGINQAGQIGINADASTDYRVYVNGTTYLNGNTSINGDIIFPAANKLDWNDGTYRQRIVITDDSTADTAVFSFQQSTNSGSNYTDLFVIKDNGTILSRDFYHRNANNTTDASLVTGATGTANSGENNATRGTLGKAILTLGNSTVRPAANTAGGANNSQGYIRIYGEGSTYGELTYDNSIGMFSSGCSIYLSKTANSGINNEIRGIMAANDYWRVAGGATASNSGYMEIATANEGTEPIYVRQYSNTFSTIARTLTLLDASGNTTFPGTVTASSGFIGNASSATYLGNIGRLTSMDVNFGSTDYNKRFFISYADANTTTHKPGANAIVMNLSWDNLNSDKYGAQIAIYNTEKPNLQIRGCKNGTWDASWLTVLSTENYDDYALPLAGGTMNSNSLITAGYGATHRGVKVGNTYINAIDGNLILQNNSAIRFGTDDWDYNKWAGLKYDSSNKTIYLGIPEGTIFTKNGTALSDGVVELTAIRYFNINGRSVLNVNNAIDNTAFTTVLSLFHNESNQNTTTTFDATKSSWGITFQRQWNTGNICNNAAGIYAFGYLDWKTGLVFRTKNATANTNSHNINALILAPDGTATFPGTVNATTFTGDLSGTATYATLIKPIATTTTASASTWNIPSGCKQVWGERFSDSTLKYTQDGTESTITDTGDWTIWLAPSATSNTATLNMRIDGTYYGALSGNASSATQVKVTSTSLPTSGNKTRYITMANSTTTGNQDIYDCARLYLYENTTTSYLVIGSASTTGGLTIRNKNGKYVDIVTSAFSANCTLTIPDATGTIALTSSSITGNAATATRLVSNDISTTTTATNLNNLKDDNFTIYYAGGSNTVTNNPLTTGTAFGLMVYRNASGYRVQDYVSSGGVRLTRFWNASTWSDWEHVVRSNDAGEGNGTTPVYINADGKATSCSTYAGGTKVTYNGTDKGASTASFYAPADAGTVGQYLRSTGAAPEWVAPTAWWGKCETAAGTVIKDVTCSSFPTGTNLTAGTVIFVYFTTTNTGAVGSIKLRVNSSEANDAKPIKYIYNGTSVNNLPGTGYLRGGQTYLFTYDGTNWVTRAQYNTDNTDALYSAGGANRVAESSTNGGIGIHRYSLQMLTATSTWSSIASDYPSAATTNGNATNKSAASCDFLITSPILYQDTNANAAPGGSANVNGYESCAMDLRYSATNAHWGSLTIQKPVYLVGKPNSNGTFKLDATKWWTQDLPSSADGNIYIYLGLAYSATNIYLYPWHPAYYHDGTNLRQYSGIENLGATKGDIMYWSAANVPARLAIGSAGAYLKATADGPVWDSLSNVGTVGTITSGTWNGNIIGIDYGGTGLNSADPHKILIGPSSGTTAAAPTWRTLVNADLPTVDVAHGGTGLTTATNVNAVVIGNSSNAANAMQTVATASGAFYATGANVKPVFGKLPIAQGGTGATSFTKDCVIVNDGATTPALVSRGLKVTGATNGNITLAPNTSGKTMTISSATGAMTISTTTAAMTISSTTGAFTISSTTGNMTVGPTDSGTLTVGSVNGAMTVGPSGTGALTIQTNSGNMSISSAGTLSLTSGSAKSMQIASGDTLSISSASGKSTTISSGDSISITSASGKNATITSGNDIYIDSAASKKHIFRKNTTAFAEFNSSGMLQLNESTSTQSTHKLYVNGDSAFNGKIAFATAAASAMTTKAYMQWNTTDLSIDFVFA